jgi:hypothetical protein
MGEHKVGDRVIVTLLGRVTASSPMTHAGTCIVDLDGLDVPMHVPAEDVHAFDPTPDVLLGTDGPALPRQTRETLHAVADVTPITNGHRPKPPGGRMWSTVPMRGKRVDWIRLTELAREDRDVAFLVKRDTMAAARLARRDLHGLGVESEVWSAAQGGPAVVVWSE